MRQAVLGIAAMAACVLLYGWLGAPVHRSADTVDLLRPIMALAVLGGAWAAKTGVIRVCYAGLGLVGLGPVLILLLAQPAGGDLRIYAKNLTSTNDRVLDLANDIELAQVDIVVLQELSMKNAGLPTALKPNFEHQHICRFPPSIAIAVLSRAPFAAEPVCSSHRAMAAAQIDLGEQLVWVVSTHIPWPWPWKTATNEMAAETLIANLDGPVVIAGDLNAFPWTGRVRRLARLSGTRLAGPMRPTLYLRGVPLPLDHVLAPRGGAIEVRPLFGSDHHGIVADIGL